MVTITLPPELESIVTRRAEQQGTTPELLAIDGLREKFMPAVEDAPRAAAGTMAEFLGDFIGCFDSREIAPGGVNLAEDTGAKFKELMLKKYRAGKL
jgi:hypothetical protein